MSSRFKAAAVILAVLLAFAGLAQAQIWGRPGNYNNHERSYQAGYRDGMAQGRHDSARGVRFNYHTVQYNRGGGGFWGNSSDKNAYRDGYRAGYEAGYRERGGNYGGWGQARNNGPWWGNGPWGNSRPYGNGPYGNGPYGNGPYGGGNVTQIARDNGYRQGTIKGSNDARQRKSYDLNRHDDYKHGDQGYNSSYGDKNAYKQAYRAGFTQGYQQGYNSNGGGYGNRRW